MRKKQEGLSKRECQVCDLLLEGLTNKAIARRLNLSIKTVESHRARLMAKTGCRTVAQLVRQRIPVRDGMEYLSVPQ